MARSRSEVWIDLDGDHPKWEQLVVAHGGAHRSVVLMAVDENTALAKFTVCGAGDDVISALCNLTDAIDAAVVKLRDELHPECVQCREVDRALDRDGICDECNEAAVPDLLPARAS